MLFFSSSDEQQENRQTKRVETQYKAKWLKNVTCLQYDNNNSSNNDDDYDNNGKKKKKKKNKSKYNLGQLVTQKNDPKEQNVRDQMCLQRTWCNHKKMTVEFAEKSLRFGTKKMREKSS